MTRDELYKQFGPKLLEAVVLMIKDEINALRIANGLAERTNEQLINALETKIENLFDYSWAENN